MTTSDLKTILVNHLEGPSENRTSVNREIIDQIIGGKEPAEIPLNEAMVFQVNGTIVFLSEAGFSLPRRIVFLDLKSRKSFLQEIE